MDSAANFGDSSSKLPAKRTLETDPADVTAQALNKIIDYTQQAGSSHPTPGGTDLEAFQRVARQNAGQPLVLEPIVVELVRAALEPRALPAATLERVARSVAGALYEDPSAREHLQRLWTLLTERGL